MKTRNLCFSRYAHAVTLADLDYDAIYNSLSLEVIILQKKVTSLVLKKDFLKINRQTIDKLIGSKILIPQCKNDKEQDQTSFLKEINSSFQKNILGVLCIMLTESCNLRCNYCFVENKFSSSHNFENLSPEMAKIGIDVFANHLSESMNNGLINPIISFYGGEPTLNFSTLKYCLEYIESLKKVQKFPENTTLTINTNGTLITPEIAEVLKQFNVSASVSLDGPEEIHNNARKDIYGKGSFQNVLKGIRILREHAIPVGISCAVSMHNLNQLKEVTKWLISEMKIKVFGFNLLLDGGVPDPSFELAEYSKKIAQGMVECFKISRAKSVQEERTFRLARSFAEGKIHYHDCGACGQQLVISPTGKFGLCPAYIHSGKNFLLPEPGINLFTHPLWQEWRQRSPITMNACQDCIALGVCGGGCPYNADIRNGSIWHVDESFCELARSMTTLLIKEVAKNTISEYNT